MQFLNPLFWLAAVAIAAPILLHLMRREKTDLVLFPSLMFLRRIPRKELKRRRLKYLFLLFLRCLGLLLLVAAFARPVATRDWAARISPLLPRSAIILIDHSLSMSHQPTWNRALETAEAIIDSLRDEDEGLLMQFGEAAAVLSQWERPAALRPVLRNKVAPGFEGTSYLEGLRIAADQFKGAHNSQKEIYVITDLQQRGLAAGLGWKVPAAIRVHVKDVGEEISNLFIEEARLEREVFQDRFPFPVLVRLGTSPPRALQGEAQLFLEGKLADRRSFELGESGSGNVTFKPFEVKEGILRGKIVVEPGDALPSDNVFFFVAERKTPRPITVISRRATGSAFYLLNALSAGQNLPFAMRPLAAPGPASLQASDTPVTIIDDLAQPPAPALFERYVKAGGGLIMALGGSVQREAYNRQWASLLPVELLDRSFARSQQIPFTSITEVSWEHPVFSVFQDVHRAALVSSQFYGYWKVAPQTGAVALARFSGGDPALVEWVLGKGRVLVFTSSLDTVWTDFPLRSSYLPFWNRMVQYAGGWQSRPAAMKVSQVLPARDSAAPLGGSSPSWNALDPRGQRIVGLDGETPPFIPLKLPGHYEIRSNKATDWIAVNPQPQESDVRRASLQEFEAALVSQQAQTSSDSIPSGSVREQEKQQSLWWIFLILATLVLGAEVLLANGYYGRSSVS